MEDFPEKSALAEAVRQADGLGRKVAIVLHQHRRNVPHLFDEVRQLAKPVRVERIHRTNGMERIIFKSGGSIRFFAPEHNIRGYLCDVIVASDVFTDEQMREILHANETSEHRQLIRLGDLEAQS